MQGLPNFRLGTSRGEAPDQARYKAKKPVNDVGKPVLVQPLTGDA